MEHFIQWFGSDSASHLGDFLTGVAALAGVAFTVLAVPYELKEWRMQERIRTQADAAAKLQVAVTRFVEAIQSITSPLSFEVVDLNKTPTERIYERFYKRMQENRSEIEAFLHAWTESEVYLPDEIDHLTAELWSLWTSIKVEFETWYDYSSDRNAKEEMKESHRFVFGKETRENLYKIQVKLKSVLKPLARLE